jgi:hypothetical protein
MLRLITLAAAATLAMSAPAAAQEEWKWGVNFYDLQLHSIPADDSAVAADICSSAFFAMVDLMQDEGGNEDTIDQLREFGLAWREEGANRREIDLQTYNDKYMVPAFGLMRDLNIDHHTFWTEYCLDLTRRSVESRDK